MSIQYWVTHSSTSLIQVDKNTPDQSLLRKYTLHDPDSYGMSVFLHQNRPLLIFKSSLCQYNQMQNGQWVNILSEVVCNSAFESVGWQAEPSCQIFKSSADVCCVQSNQRGEKMALWQRTAVNQMVHSHLVVQWAVTEVTSVWLISMPWNHSHSQCSHQHMRWQHVWVSSTRAPRQAPSLPSLCWSLSLCSVH